MASFSAKVAVFAEKTKQMLGIAESKSKSSNSSESKSLHASSKKRAVKSVGSTKELATDKPAASAKVSTSRVRSVGERRKIAGTDTEDTPNLALVSRRDHLEVTVDDVMTKIKALPICLTDDIISVENSISELVTAYGSIEDSVHIVLLVDHAGLTNVPGSRAALAKLNNDLKVWHKKTKHNDNCPIEITRVVAADQRKVQLRYSALQQSLKTAFADDSKWKTLIDKILLDSMDLDASDIHIEKREEQSTVRLRVNGELIDYMSLEEHEARSVINVLWNTIAKQQGSAFEPSRRGHKASAEPTTIRDGVATSHRLRLQTIPHEETTYDLIARRLPSRDSGANIDLYTVGYHPKQLALFEKAMRCKQGVIVFAGTTGSGKTTSCVACVQKFITLYTNSKGESRIKVITIEDPVEVQIDKTTQISIVNEDENNDGVDQFAASISWCLRSDPDFMMVSEVRTTQAATNVVKGIQTGHPMVTTVHASSAFGIINRFVNIGMKLEDIVSKKFLNLLVYQDLAKVVCKSCCIPMSEHTKLFNDMDARHVESFKEMIRDLENINMNFEKVVFRNPEGCTHCRNTGIKGRTPVAEVVLPTREVMRLCTDPMAFEAEAEWYKDSNAMSIIDHALCKVEEGLCDPFILYNEYGDLVPTNWVTGL